MKPTVADQVKSGLRLSLGVASFMTGFIMLAWGLNRVVWSASPPSFLIWPDPMGWAALVVAAAMLLLSAGVWWRILGGYILLGSLKSVLVLITGRNIYSPYDSFPRIQAAELAAFCVATLVLMFRFGENPPTILDRIALTTYLICLLWSLQGALFMSGCGLVAGLVALLLSWYVNWWRGRKSWPTPTH